METPEHLPPLLDIPERLKKYLPQKLGFQLNGVETVLAAYPSEQGVHCQNCCPNFSAEHFLTENCDLWWVTQAGEIYVLPFGEDEAELKYTAKNYIPWRPYRTFFSDSCFGLPKTTFLKPHWKDYIGFQTDEFECVIFWRRELIYHGTFDGRGIPQKYNYHEEHCDVDVQTYEHYPYVRDDVSGWLPPPPLMHTVEVGSPAIESYFVIDWHPRLYPNFSLDVRGHTRITWNFPFYAYSPLGLVPPEMSIYGVSSRELTHRTALEITTDTGETAIIIGDEPNYLDTDSILAYVAQGRNTILIEGKMCTIKVLHFVREIYTIIPVMPSPTIDPRYILIEAGFTQIGGGSRYEREHYFDTLLDTFTINLPKLEYNLYSKYQKDGLHAVDFLYTNYITYSSLTPSVWYEYCLLYGREDEQGMVSVWERSEIMDNRSLSIRTSLLDLPDGTYHFIVQERRVTASVLYPEGQPSAWFDRDEVVLELPPRPPFEFADAFGLVPVQWIYIPGSSPDEDEYIPYSYQKVDSYIEFTISRSELKELFFADDDEMSEEDIDLSWFRMKVTTPSKPDDHPPDDPWCEWSGMFIGENGIRRRETNTIFGVVGTELGKCLHGTMTGVEYAPGDYHFALSLVVNPYPEWGRRKRSYPDTYFYTWRDCKKCENDPPDPCKCGYVSASENPASNYSRWKTWQCLPVNLVDDLLNEGKDEQCSKCRDPDMPFDADGKPSPEPPPELVESCEETQENNTNPLVQFEITTTCSERQCAVPEAEFCGFQITGCEDGNTARFMVRNNIWSIRKLYRFLGYKATKEDIPGFWEPQEEYWEDGTPGYLPPRDISSELAEVDIYNAPQKGLYNFDVFGVLPEDWDELPDEEKEFPAHHAKWYYLLHERWVEGSGTVHDLRYANSVAEWGYLYQDEVTSTETTVCLDEDAIPVVPGGALICCGDWWAANFGGETSASRVVGYRGELLFKAPGVPFKGRKPTNPDSPDDTFEEPEVMEEQMVCCDDWLFARVSIADDRQLNMLYAIERDEYGNFVEAKETWREETSYAEAYRACCTDKSTEAGVNAWYLRLANLWSDKAWASFYKGEYLKTYDWRKCPHVYGVGEACAFFPNRAGHAEVCVDCNPGGWRERRFDVYYEGERILECTPVCQLLTFDGDNGEEVWAVELVGIDFRVSDVWTNPPLADLEWNWERPPNNNLCPLSQRTVRWQAVNRCVLLETGQLFSNVIAGDVVSMVRYDTGVESLTGLPFNVQSGFNAVYGFSAPMEERIAFALNPMGWYRVLENRTGGAPRRATGWHEVCVFTGESGNRFPQRDEGDEYYFRNNLLMWMFLDVHDWFAPDFHIIGVMSGLYGVHFVAPFDFSLHLAAYRPYRMCRQNCLPREIPLKDRWHDFGQVSHNGNLPISIYAASGLCVPSPRMGIPGMSVGWCRGDYDTARSSIPFLDSGLLSTLRFPEAGNCNGYGTDRGAIHSFKMVSSSQRGAENADLAYGYCRSGEMNVVTSRHLVSEPVTCQQFEAVEFSQDSSVHAHQHTDSVGFLGNESGIYRTPWRGGLGSGCWNTKDCNCIPIQTTCWHTEPNGQPLDEPTTELADYPHGTTSSGRAITVAECYGWNISWEGTDPPKHPDDLIIELDVIDSYISLWQSYDAMYFSAEFKTLPLMPPVCPSPLAFSCVRDRLMVRGYTVEDTLFRFSVFDRHKGKIYFGMIEREAGFNYAAECCGDYWMLFKSRDGVTVVTLFYIEKRVTAWENASAVYNFVTHSFRCCGSGFILKQHEGDDEEVVAVYVCGVDVTDTIPEDKLQDDLRSGSCCGEYVILVAGKWEQEWDIHVVYEDVEGCRRVNREESYAYLEDGTRCVVAETDEIIEETEFGTNCHEQVRTWKTDDDDEWQVAHPPERDSEDPNMLDFITAHLPFRVNITNTRWAALYHCGTQIIVDQRLELMRCIQSGEDTFALCPIMDDIDLHRFKVEESYRYKTGGEDDPLAESCEIWGDSFFGRWIHNPQDYRDRRVPNLTAADARRLAVWWDSYPMMGVYIVHNGELVSLNPGAEAKGGRDIQEKMPPDDTPHGEEFTAPEFTPSGDYLYFNDRNAVVRYDKKVEGLDQRWNHNCGSIPITLSAQSLEDFPAAPSFHSQGKKPVYGIEGAERGRLVIGGNSVLSVFDSEQGRMDISASNGCKLR